MKLPGRLKKISKRLRLDLSSGGELGSAIILGDGTPDDVVVAIVCYHLNGDKIAGLIKPEGVTGPSVVELIPKTYLKMKVGKFAVVVDQEVDYPTVEKLVKDVEKRLKSHHVELEILESYERLRVYRCKSGGREFELVLIVNGLDEVPVKVHQIEDHLIRAANDIGLDVDITKIDNSKVKWLKIDKRHKNEVFRKLVDDRKLTFKLFPQHAKGLGYLES
jgi:hypothetical protein